MGVQGPGWWAFRLLWVGFVRLLLPVLSGWSGGQHLFMVRSGGCNMTLPALVGSFREEVLGVVSGTASARFVLPKGVWTLSTLKSALCESRRGEERGMEFRIASGMGRLDCAGNVPATMKIRATTSAAGVAAGRPRLVGGARPATARIGLDL